jgi:hypothetical protein
MKPLEIGNASEGITVEFVRSRNSIWLCGYYDHCVGIRGGQFTLAEFFRRLSITKKDAMKAFEEKP